MQPYLLSILIFWVWPLKHYFWMAMVRRIPLSILIFWVWPLKRTWILCTDHQPRLSILILWVWPLRLPGESRPDYISTAFNPHFLSLTFETLRTTNRCWDNSWFFNLHFLSLTFETFACVSRSELPAYPFNPHFLRNLIETMDGYYNMVWNWIF